MARCWSCGSEIAGAGRYYWTCPTCEGVQEIKSLRKEASDNLSRLVGIQQHGFEMLSERLSEVATVIVWGFETISWELHKQTDILRSIDHTLKTPSETQANEWRRMAEELRSRGVLDKSEELFLKALDLNPLDYRIYAGLAHTYLQMNQFDKARSRLKESLPHAPKLHYKSYSFRLIGRTYFCEENYQQAASMLKTAVELSPNYEDAHYDYAQYCALVGKKKDCLDSLGKSILAKSLYFYLAQKEKILTLCGAMSKTF
jgi:tetratricopeptide (TPR) repeat protein